MALALIPSAAMVGVAAALANAKLVGQGLERPGLDVALIFVFGVGRRRLKQAAVHRRRPLE